MISGFRTLLYKEVLRFWKVNFQTIAAPVLTALLYLMIFSHVLEAQVWVHGVAYTSFLIPGLVMMSALQNAFANSSSSLIQSKVTGSVIFVLLPPISYVEFFFAYVVAAVLRALMVALGVLLVTIWFAVPAMVAPQWILLFLVLGGGTMGALGMIAGIWAEQFELRADGQQQRERHAAQKLRTSHVGPNHQLAQSIRRTGKSGVSNPGHCHQQFRLLQRHGGLHVVAGRQHHRRHQREPERRWHREEPNQG